MFWRSLTFLYLHFLYFALFTFHIFFFAKLSLKIQFEIEFLPPNNGGKKVLKNLLMKRNMKTLEKKSI